MNGGVSGCHTQNGKVDAGSGSTRAAAAATTIDLTSSPAPAAHIDGGSKTAAVEASSADVVVPPHLSSPDINGAAAHEQGQGLLVELQDVHFGYNADRKVRAWLRV